MSNQQPKYLIRAAYEQGHPIRMVSGDDITWAGEAPTEAEINAIKVAASASQRKAEVSAECRRRIYAVATSETQSNMALAQGQISAKTASQRSAGETETLVGIGLALSWVQGMRATYAALVLDAEAEFSTDSAWPECPPEVVAVVDMF